MAIQWAKLGKPAGRVLNAVGSLAILAWVVWFTVEGGGRAWLTVGIMAAIAIVLLWVRDRLLNR